MLKSIKQKVKKTLGYVAAAIFSLIVPILIIYLLHKQGKLTPKGEFAYHLVHFIFALPFLYLFYYMLTHLNEISK